MGLFGGKSETEPGGSASEPSPQRPRPRTAPAGSPAPNPAPTVISRETKVKGELTSHTDILIEGQVEGRIQGAKHVVVGETGDVEAKIEAEIVTVRGKIAGDCDASTRFEITHTGKVFGNISARAIVVAEGATFRGSSKMMAESGPSSTKRTDTQERADTQELQKVSEPSGKPSTSPAAKSQAPPPEPPRS